MHRIRRAMGLLIASALAVLLTGPVPQALAQESEQPEFRALLFTKAVGYVHNSIPNGIAMFERQAAEEGFELVETDDSSVFNDEDLATFDAVIMLQNSGMVWETEEEREAIQTYLRNGGGITAVHNSLDMGIENDFPWWDDTINGGAHMPTHSPGTLDGTAWTLDRVHPSTEHLPQVWDRAEEWYNFDPNPRGNVHVLVAADERTYNPGNDAMGPDHPISWCHRPEGGRVWATAMGHEPDSYDNEPLFQQHVLGGLKWAAGVAEGDCGGTVWNNFEKITLDGDTDDPMQLDVADDGRVFVAERGGDLTVFKPDTNTTVTAGSLDVYTGGEDGLVGMTLDPDFAENGWVYLYYSPADADEDINRLSRFTIEGDTLDLASESVVLDVPAYRSRTYPEPGHTGGALDFGIDGSLFLGVGDDVPPNLSSHWQGYAPIDWRPGQEMLDAARTSGNTNDLRGKILRITPLDEGGYAIPEGNLFEEGTELTRPEIYGMGFRNPFRFRVDPETGHLHVSDYGPDRHGQPDERGPQGFVEYDVLTEPVNSGWPFCHGNNEPYAPYNPDTGEVGEKFDCDNLVNESPNNTGLTELPPAEMPQVWYDYAISPEFPELGSGGSGPMSGPVYRFDPDSESETKFPEYFDGVHFFYEWTRDYIKEFHLDEDNQFLKSNDFLANETFNKPMDMEFGSDGSLYLLEWGSGFGGGNSNSGLYRIDYNQGQSRPVAVATASATNGPTPLEVTFSSEGSNDPAGGDITLGWDFDGDGTVDSTEANPTHVYTEPGVFTAQLRVTNVAEQTGYANIEITVGNTAPTVVFDAPPNGGLIEFGEDVSYELTVTDPEDGEVDCAEVLVRPALGHDDHEHDTSDIAGCSGTVDTADLGGHPEGANLYYVLNGRYTDGGGEGVGSLTGYDRRVLQPKNKQAEYFTDSSGVRVVNDAGAESGARVGDVSDGDWIAFDPISLENIDSVSYRVSSIIEGASIELRAGSPEGELVATTSVQNTGGWSNYEQTESVDVELAGSHTVYLVFRSPANNSLDLDSVRFEGAGFSTPPGGGEDTTAPVTTASTTPSEPDGQEGWYTTSPVQITLEATDDAGDVATTEYRIGDGDWTTYEEPITLTDDGTHTVDYRSTDTAGNTEDTQTLDIALDTTAPTTEVVLPESGGQGWHDGEVTVELTASDEGSGVARTEWSLDGGDWTAYTEPVTVTGEGPHSVLYRTVDVAGNVEDEKAATILIDPTAPTLLVAGVADGRVYGDATDLVLSWHAEDATSGIDSVVGTLNSTELASGEYVPLHRLSLGIQELSVTATDRAGNTTEQSVSFATTTSTRDISQLIDRFRATNRLSLTATTQLRTQLTTARLAEAGGDDFATIAELQTLQTLVGDTSLVTAGDVRSTLDRDIQAVIDAIEGG
ncbi:ThuA domain-containing protein [Actinoalloteichus fjordicus]|uniref:Glucose/sorbosone dehydrogenase n=1 Tax=Actinoalloteichus fjordicus TaxID=1612552 RepID=A0AAC9LDV0_9PSEU|nr:ThuA domain-containing protein [Actinoalloteichus fjordicus]APU16158.1 glucose/sorbosone dehydrogenase [Actinoalloteichus fjordicus]